MFRGETSVRNPQSATNPARGNRRKSTHEKPLPKQQFPKTGVLHYPSALYTKHERRFVLYFDTKNAHFYGSKSPSEALSRDIYFEFHLSLFKAFFPQLLYPTIWNFTN
jgi:hypothetical protein